MEVRQFFPLFGEGRILKKDALDIIRDYAPDFFALLFGAYGDGVAAGFRISGREKEITVGPGILKQGSYFFCMREEVRLTYASEGQTVQIVLKDLGESVSPDFRASRYGLTLEAVRALGKGEYELGRFLLEPGARLRTCGDYKDFNDFVTQFNTLNAVHVPFACENGSTLAPFILRSYGKDVLHSPKAEPLDLSFAVACLNSSRIPSGLIREYLRAKGQETEEGSNLQLYRGLQRLYAGLVSGGERRRRPRETGGKTVIE